MIDADHLDDLYQGGDRSLEVDGPPVHGQPVLHDAIVIHLANFVMVFLLILADLNLQCAVFHIYVGVGGPEHKLHIF